MSKLKKSDFYYGAVLSTLVNHKICPMMVENDGDRQVYDFTTDHKDFRLFVKYCSTPNTSSESYRSWQFVFSDFNMKEIRNYMNLNKEFCIGLVCGQNSFNESHLAILQKKEIEEIFSSDKTAFTISLKKGERAFRVSLDGSRKNALLIKTNWFDTMLSGGNK